MDFLNEFLPIVIYILLVVLIILLIILAYRLIKTMDKVKLIVDSVDEKVSSLNGVFAVIDRFSNGFSIVGDRFIDLIVNFFSKIFKSKKEENKEDDSYEGKTDFGFGFNCPDADGMGTSCICRNSGRSG